MNNHPIFDAYTPVECTGTGSHMFDFLGARTDVSVKAGYGNYAVPTGRTYTAKLPTVNEHYPDWFTLLMMVSEARGVFRMAELGAGWAPWLVSGAYAAKQMPEIGKVQLVGVEADRAHFGWAERHFRDNGLSLTEHTLIHGAVSPLSEVLRFPKITDPTQDYGASLMQGKTVSDFVEVQGYMLDHIFGLFDGPIDFVHSDIQGAEYDVFPSNMDLVNRSVRNIMIGTHFSAELHDGLKDIFEQNGWVCEIAYPRNTLCETGYGEVQFHDGFLFFRNSRSL